MCGRPTSAIALLIAVAASACASQRIRDVAWRAGEDGKVLVAEFYRPGEAAAAFEREVLSDDGVRAALSDVVYRRYDVTGGLGKTEAERLGVYDTPTFIVFRRDGLPVAALDERPTAATLRRWLLLAPILALGEVDIRRRLDRGRTPARLLLAARWLFQNRRYDEAAGLYDQALAAPSAFDADARARIAWELALARSAGGSRAAFARRAAEHAVRYITGPTGPSALEVALLSGGLHGGEPAELVKRCLVALGENPTRTAALAYLLALTDEDADKRVRARNRVHGLLRSLDIAIPDTVDTVAIPVGESPETGE